MCGICGIIHADNNRTVERSHLEKMKDKLVHRGPNDEGSYLNGPVGLGFRRLSIIDLEHGHQPMSNEDDSVWIVFNGEIYNHDEIRREMISAGHVFRTRCDTESIIHLYEESGIDGLSKLNGMFAIAIWDDRTKTTYLIRDRLGIKPLYYSTVDGSILFGSEIKSILQYPGMKRSANINKIEEYLLFRFVAGADTMFENVHSLLPGQVLIYRDGQIRKEQYWNFPELSIHRDLNEETALEQLEELLEDSVRMRLMSDVPLGALCSGGVDSGLTTAFATKHASKGIDTFSVGLHEAEYDESEFALMVTNRYKTRHHTMKIDNETFSDTLEKMIWYLDEPLNHANSVPIHHIANLARNHVTVVLTGEGSDELFGGYPRYLIPSIYSKVSRLPRFARSAMRDLIGLTGMRRMNKLGHFLPQDIDDVAVFNSAFNKPATVSNLLSGETDGNHLSYRYSLIQEPALKREELLERIWRLDLKTYLASLLNRMDKMTMAASIEARVPFLDHRLVEWSFRVPAGLKIKSRQTKYIVKKLSERFLPREVIYRRKSGFGLPIDSWLRDRKLLGRFLDMFFEPRFEQRGFLDAKQVQLTIKEHLDNKADHSEIIWELLNLELWYRKFIEDTD